MTTRVRNLRQRAFRDDSYVDTYTGSKSSVRNTYDFDTSESVIGGDYPGWRRAIKDGAIIFNAVSSSRRKVEIKTGNAEHVSSYKGWNGFAYVQLGTATYKAGGYLCPLTTITNPVGADGSALNQAKSRFVARVRSEQTRFQSGIALGELRETIRLIRHPASAINRYLTNYVSDLKKNRKSIVSRAKGRSPKETIRNVNKQIADKWLTASFGIKPLINDIQDLARAAAEESIKRNGTRIPLRGAGHAESFVANIPASGGIGGATWSYSNSIVDSTDAWVYGSMVAKSLREQSTLSNFGLDMSNVLPTVYNLIPWTFLLDYFVNLDDVIDAATLRTCDLLFWGQSVHVKRVCKIVNIVETTNKSDPNPNSSGFHYLSSSVSPGNSSWTSETFNRSLAPSLVPSIRFKIPGTASKYGNMIALAFSRSRSITPYHKF